jgi:hypothetical protein
MHIRMDATRMDSNSEESWLRWLEPPRQTETDGLEEDDGRYDGIERDGSRDDARGGVVKDAVAG